MGRQHALPHEHTEEEMPSLSSSCTVLLGNEQCISVSDLRSLSNATVDIPCKYLTDIMLAGCKINQAENHVRLRATIPLLQNYSTPCWWGEASHAVTALPLMTVFPDKGQHVVLGEFLRIDTALGVVNSDPFLPGPKQSFLMTHPEKREGEDDQNI